MCSVHSKTKNAPKRNSACDCGMIVLVDDRHTSSVSLKVTNCEVNILFCLCRVILVKLGHGKMSQKSKDYNIWKS